MRKCDVGQMASSKQISLSTHATVMHLHVSCCEIMHVSVEAFRKMLSKIRSLHVGQDRALIQYLQASLHADAQVFASRNAAL
jgi:hypothetical protein